MGLAVYVNPSFVLRNGAAQPYHQRHRRALDCCAFTGARRRLQGSEACPACPCPPTMTGSMARCENPVGVAHLEFRDSSGHPTSVEPEQVEAVLTSATSRRKTPVLVTRTARSGRLKLEFGYQNCGAHALTVTVNGQQVMGSPFFFRLKPSQSSSCRLSGNVRAPTESESAVTLVRANEFDTEDSRAVPVGSAAGVNTICTSQQPGEPTRDSLLWSTCRRAEGNAVRASTSSKLYKITV